MAQKVARTLLLTLLLALGFGLLGSPSLGTPVPADTLKWTGAARAAAQRHVFLGGGLGDEETIGLTAAVAASGHPGAVLLDTPKSNPSAKDFLAHFRPERVIPVGSFPDGIHDLERRLNVMAGPVVPWKRGPPEALWKVLFPTARNVVVCPAQPRRLLLQAACLAGVVHAPLVVLHGKVGDADRLDRRLAKWDARQVYAVGKAARACRSLRGVKVLRLPDEEAVTTAYLRHQLRKGPVHTLVVANPADTGKDLGGMSALAPWVALQKRAALLLTNDDGSNVEAVVKRALKDQDLLRAESVILVANLKAIPMDKRPNPIPSDKDQYIEMEPLTPTGSEPFSFAIGRLFNEDPAVVALILARERLLRNARGPRRALLVSNPAGGLPLLEAFSRNTAMEFKNAGYETTALFGHDVSKEKVRKLLPAQDIFLWEGHHNTLIREYCVQEWPEPLRPGLVFLQSCLALTEEKAQPFLQRGAVGVIGSSTRMYSASGGACALAFFDALHYNHATVGGGLRHAKNFLLAYSQLKEKRLGKDSKKHGANIRASWSFTLWGDPTVRLPRTEPPKDALAAVAARVHGHTIYVDLPDTHYPRVVTAKYQATMRPNGKEAGLLRAGDENGKRLVPFIFAEVRLPKAPAGKAPRLHSRIPGRNWVFCWDHRRKVGYLLVTPRAKDQRELRFHVKWEDRE